MKKRLLTYMLLTTVFTSALVTAIIGLNSHNTIDNLLQSQRKYQLQMTEKFIRSFDQLMFDIEKKMYTALAPRLPQLAAFFKNSYFRNNSSVEQLKQLAHRYGFDAIYLINTNLQVFNTSYPPDLKLDFSKSRDYFTGFLKSIFSKGRVYPQRSALSTLKGVRNFYMYYSPPDSDYIIETSVGIDRYVKQIFSPQLHNYLYSRMFKLLTDEQETRFESFDIFQVSGMAQFSMLNTGRRLGLNQNQLKILLSKGSYSFRTEGVTRIYNMYQPKLTAPFNYADRYVYELTFDNKVLTDYISSSLYYLLGITVIIVLLIFIPASHYMNRYFIQRIIKINDALLEIGQGNYNQILKHSGKDEIDSIAENFNRMCSIVRSRKQDLIRKNTEIRDLKDYLSNILNSMPALIIATDPWHNIVQINRQAEEVFKLTQEKAVGLKIWEVSRFFQNIAPMLKKTINSGQNNNMTNVNLPEKPDNSFNMVLFPLIQMNFRGVVIMLYDITEIEQKEQQLRQAQKMETIGNLAGGLAHDFNNVLAGIIGTVSLIKYSFSEDNSAEPLSNNDLLEKIHVIDHSAQRAANLVHQLLLLSQKRELNITSVDLNESIRNVLRICHNTFDKSIEIISHYHNEPAIIFADESQLEQILLNLSINASHAMTLMRGRNEPHGGTLFISIDFYQANKDFKERHPHSHYRQYWRLTIRDTGVGIEKKTLQKIFEPFYSTKKIGIGSGLGLTMVYNIIQQHEGEIEVNSTPGEGTTFHLFFPVSLQHLKITAEKKQQTKIPQTIDKCVLIIDDEELVRVTMRTMLEKTGMEVLEAINGTEGIALYREHRERIDIVILDMTMPGISGKKTYQELRSIDSRVKVLLVSGLKTDTRIKQTLESGADGFIAKPYTYETLITELLRIISESS